MSMKIVETRNLYRWGFRLAVLFFCLGALAGGAASHYLIDKLHVPQEAMRQAREVVDAEMRAACTNWFTDKRSAALPEGRIVTCKAPGFLSNPLR